MLKYPIKLKNSTNYFQNVPVWLSHKVQIRNHSNDPTKRQSFQSFQQIVKHRQSQAKRSVFIESAGDPKSINHLTTCCSKFGKIQTIYRSDVGAKSYFLVEFSNLAVPHEIIRSALHSGNFLVDGKIRSKSRFLSFATKNEPLKKMENIVKHETNLTNRSSILKAMRNKTTDDQIMTLYKVNGLSDLSSRLRFLTALQIEEAISGVVYDAQVLPFGSSINGFGRMQSDLDMILTSGGNKTNKSQFISMELGRPDDQARNTVRNNLYVMSSIVRHWLHGVVDVTPVLNARIPIIKYVQSLTGLECDLSMGNYSGYQMSELLHTFGEMDPRVRPFVFYIRAWAKEFDLIQPFPAHGVSNFMLTCLVIFFLQQMPEPVLPPSGSFVTLEDTADGVQFITDFSKVNFKSKNTSTLADLLVEFFEFYSKFDFTKNAVSIPTGQIKTNITADSMYIHNPIDPGLNVSRNVSDYERNEFIEKCQIALKVLTTNQCNAVELLDYYGKKNNSGKIDSFVSDMMITGANSSKSKTIRRKIDVKRLIKTP